MTPQADSLSREERIALRRLRELLKEQQRAQAAPPSATPPANERPQNA